MPSAVGLQEFLSCFETRARVMHEMRWIASRKMQGREDKQGKPGHLLLTRISTLIHQRL